MQRWFYFNIPESIDKVIEIYKDTDFFIETMKLAGARSVEITKETNIPLFHYEREAKITASLMLPTFLGSSRDIIITNKSSFFPNKRKLYWSVVSNIAAKFVDLSGEIEIEPATDGVKLKYNANVDIHFPGLGRKTESLILQIIGRKCAEQANFVSECIRRRIASAN